MSKGAVGALGALLTLVCWALSSPPGSAPDEPFHLASAWCAWGTDTDHCRVDPDPRFRLLPHQVVNGQCFTGNMAQSAECRPRDYNQPLTPDQATAFGNWNTGYPPVFYATMRLFVTDGYDTSVALMRIANAVIGAGLVIGLALLLPRRLRQLPGYVYVLTAVPLSLFFIASANPSSWAIISAGVLWMSVYAAYEVEGRRRWALLGYGLLATVVGSGSRADAALFSILGIGLAMGLQLRLLRRAWPVTAAAAAMAVVAALLYLTAGHAGVVGEGLPGYPPAAMSDTQLASATCWVPVPVAGCPGGRPVVEPRLVRHPGPVRDGGLRAAGLRRRPRPRVGRDVVAEGRGRRRGGGRPDRPTRSSCCRSPACRQAKPSSRATCCR